MKLFILRMKVPCAIFVIKMPYQNVLSLSKRGLALKVLSKLLYAIADNKGNYEELKILHQKILNDSLSLNELASDSGNDTFRIEEIPWERLLDAISYLYFPYLVQSHYWQVPHKNGHGQLLFVLSLLYIYVT